MKNIAVIGAGYVGLVLAACLSELGENVICVDKDKRKLEKLKKCKVHFYEQELSELIKKNMKDKKLEFSECTDYAVRKSEIIYIAVGTPSKDDGSVELKFVYDAITDIANSMNGYKIIVNKSTVPVGTGTKLKETIKKRLKERGKKYEFDVVSNPEFLREGSAVYDFMNPDRIVIGTNSERARKVIRAVYNAFDNKKVPFIFTNNESAELIKYTSNCFLAMKIAYINEIANLCEKVGANIQHVANGIGKDHRINSKYLQPGPGFGGSCFPKDNLALVRIAKEYGEEVSIVDQVIKSNEKQKLRMILKITNIMGKNLVDKKIAILGLTFKPNTSDMRESSSLVIIPKLIDCGAYIQVFDPEGIDEAKKYFNGLEHSIKYCGDEFEAVSGVDAVIILTEWEKFRNLDLELLRKNMKGQYFFDLRNVYERDQVEKCDFSYIGVGK